MDSYNRQGHLAYAFLAGGTLLVAFGHPETGFLLRAIGSAWWALLGAALNMNSILLWSSGFMVVDLIGLGRHL